MFWPMHVQKSYPFADVVGYSLNAQHAWTLAPHPAPMTPTLGMRTSFPFCELSIGMLDQMHVPADVEAISSALLTVHISQVPILAIPKSIPLV